MSIANAVSYPQRLFLARAFEKYYQNNGDESKKCHGNLI
jgi:hypothetical protein